MFNSQAALQHFVKSRWKWESPRGIQPVYVILSWDVQTPCRPAIKVAGAHTVVLCSSLDDLGLFWNVHLFHEMLYVYHTAQCPQHPRRASHHGFC
jgi:hypothetical protein